MAVCSYTPSTQEAKATELKLQGQPELLCDSVQEPTLFSPNQNKTKQQQKQGLEIMFSKSIDIAE